jgi:hypothetical protein
MTNGNFDSLPDRRHFALVDSRAARRYPDIASSRSRHADRPTR